MKGIKISSMKTDVGEKMRELILHAKLTKLYPWISNVYDKTSGLIHFSKTHIFTCTERFPRQGLNIKYSLQRSDYKVRDKERIEAIQCTVEITSLIIKMVENWLNAEHKEIKH